MARKIYLIDTENIGFAWKHLLENVHSTDKIILFYTENTPNLSYVDLAYIQTRFDKFTFEKCYIGKNALDFQLVSYMGYHMKSSSKTQFFIVSNDIGYDPVIQYWFDKGRKILRMTTKDLEALSAQKKVEVLSTEKNIAELAEAKELEIHSSSTSINIPEEGDIITKSLRDSYSESDIHWLLLMLKKYSKKELQKINQEIVKKYGSEAGNILYHIIKPLLKDHYK